VVFAGFRADPQSEPFLKNQNAAVEIPLEDPEGERERYPEGKVGDDLGEWRYIGTHRIRPDYPQAGAGGAELAKTPLEPSVLFDDGERGAALEDPLREGAHAGTDLQNGIFLREAEQLDLLVYERLVDEEVLSEERIRIDSVALKIEGIHGRAGRDILRRVPNARVQRASMISRRLP